MIEVAGSGRVDVDDINVVRIFVREARGVGEITQAVFAIELERYERGGNAGSIGRADHAAGGFTETEIGGEEAGDVEPEVRVAAGKLGAERRVAAREIVNQLSGRGRRGAGGERCQP